MPFAFMHNKDFSLYMYTPILSPSYILNGLLQSILFSIIGRARELLPQVLKKNFFNTTKAFLICTMEIGRYFLFG